MKGSGKGPTVTVVHSGTPDIHGHTRTADVIIVRADSLRQLQTTDAVACFRWQQDMPISSPQTASRKAS